MNINCPSWVTKKLNNKSSDIPTKQVTLIARSRITTKNQTVSGAITFRWCHLFSPLLRKTSLTCKMCLIQWHPLPITWSYMSADLFFAGFYFTLWTNGYTGFCQGNKNDTRRKTIQFPFRLHINVKQRILICSYTFDIKPTVQLITLNVKERWIWSFMYPWVLSTGNLRPEILAILTQYSFPWWKDDLPRQKAEFRVTEP